ncbi:hypothetical protein CROQUDRAFT_674762 [Cronartium quercuum f. sp. fusiforme G11]|uniref:Glucose-methanol-choline oxidoreductase N-terminal domain-containing protein n=1 Tax=Cronartium quercuum f. sp. fusiforme G11 TaxID=708437 RepID=A0A9P6N6T4_9BASI|nr:hypothetical protein CROQUDRAFT_674762 [Cronartium quercuum f. sp. fusiforme G11]
MLFDSKWSLCGFLVFSVACLFATSMQKEGKIVKEMDYDYVLIGGGTAGLVVASRLTENPNITVLVLEAGDSGLNNTRISTPGFNGRNISTSIDWNYSTVALEHAGNRSIIYPRGKVLGGCSATNFLVTNKASRQDYDTIEKLGNPGWGWSEFDRAAKKSENFLLPPPRSNFSFIFENHGHNGEVKTSFPKYIPPTFPNYFPAVQELGHQPALLDSFGGDSKGPYYCPSTINENAERVTSATAYYHPFASRKNLVVWLNSEVDRLLTSKLPNGTVIVKGVQYTSHGSIKTVLSNREVILSAGAIGSPAILERSGMGDPYILNKLKIPIVNSLPGVGSNLIDHPLIWSTYELRPGVISADNLITNSTFAATQLQLYNDHREGILTHAVSLLDFEPLRSYLTKEEIAEGLKNLQCNTSHLPQWMFNAVKDQLENGAPIQFLLANQRWLDTPVSSKASYITIQAALQYPLSRGSSHISSRDPTKPPLIDTGYFRNPFDLWILSKAIKHSRRIMSNRSWSSVILREETPGPKVSSDEEWKEFTQNLVSTIAHPIGTVPMLPIERGGVVNPDLRVYGTQNLRVIDASIIPIHLAMQPQITVYAIGELGAEKILKSRKEA